jgi:farnesyl-diphosphate farnesyltransferase
MDKKYLGVTKMFPEFRHQAIIKEITCSMGNGMADFIEKSRVNTLQEYNQYCYFAAGLVGIALSKLYYSCGLIDGEEWYEKHSEFNSIGAGSFLQKTNIIQDFYEDIQETRIWWPQELWSKYTDNLENFSKPEHVESAVQCLNHMITDALVHVPQVLQCLNHIQDGPMLSCCAIPHLVAMATLSACYNNPQVFSRKVSVRKGVLAKIFLAGTSMQNVNGMFYEFTSQLESKIRNDNLVSKKY